MEPQIQYAKTSDGVNIAYYALGSGPPTVYIAGLPASHLQAEWQMPELRERYERGARSNTYVRYDPRGLGLSDRDATDFSIEALVRDIEAVVNKLELEPFQLIASNNSVPMAIAYTAKHPKRVSHLVLWCGYATGRENLREPELSALAKRDWQVASEALTYASGGLAENEPIRATAALIREACTGETYVKYVDQSRKWDVRELLPAVRVPTLVLHARHFRTVSVESARKLAASIPDARLVLVEGSSVMMSAEATAALGSFLRETRAPRDEPPSKLPSGTAIILFADIADSTALTERLGDAAFRERARQLDESLPPAIRDAGGTIVEGKLLGDGLLATFTSARQAIEAARRCRDASAESGLALHLGIHAGDVIREANNVFGGAVNLAARIADASAPGEILVSDTLRGLARTSAGVEFEDRGEHELKGIAEPQRLFAVREQDGGHAR